MIGLLLPLFVRLGATQRVAKALAIGTLILAAVLLVGALWLWADSREKADDRANQEIGRTVEREEAQAETISKVETANEAAETIRRDPDAARAECLSNARNPEDC